MSKYVNLLNPDDVKTVIATQEWSEARKRNAVYAYRHLVEMENLEWTQPTYRGQSKLPFVPLEKEVDALVTSLSPILATLTKTLKETGARIGEAIQITVKDVDAEQNTITINGTEKHGLPRTIKVSKGLIAMIKRYGSYPKVFRGKADTYRRRFEIQRRRIAVKTQNPRLEYITLHTFRHYFATTLYHKTKDILYVKQQLGHRAIQNTLIYTQLVNFKTDDYTSKVALTVEEAQKLIESGFEYVTTFESKMIFRKRK